MTQEELSHETEVKGPVEKKEGFWSNFWKGFYRSREIPKKRYPAFIHINLKKFFHDHIIGRGGKQMEGEEEQPKQATEEQPKEADKKTALDAEETEETNELGEPMTYFD